MSDQSRNSSFAITLPTSIPIIQLIAIVAMIIGGYAAVRDIQENTIKNTLLIQQVQERQDREKGRWISRGGVTHHPRSRQENRASVPA